MQGHRLSGPIGLGGSGALFRSGRALQIVRTRGQGHDTEPELFEHPNCAEVFVQVRRLGDVTRCLVLVRICHITRAAATRQHDHWDVHKTCVSLDRRQHRSTVKLWQVEIQQDEIRSGRIRVGWLSMKESQRSFAIGDHMDMVGN